MQFNREQLEQVKKAQGRETKWLAEQCGIKRDTLSSYLAGRKNPSRAVVKLMALALSVPESVFWVDAEHKKSA
jgi:transcriptional regulator with XRE-family HTH domain